MKKAFTLAEVMIVLTVLGIIAGILVPMGVQSTPDKNIMKFKKADTTLKKVIGELVVSDKYFVDGILGKMPNNGRANKSTFCYSFADLVSTKKVVCDYTTTDDEGFYGHCFQADGPSQPCKSSNSNSINSMREGVDTQCKLAQEIWGKDLGILTTDGIYYYEENLNNFFGCYYKSGDSSACGNMVWMEYDPTWNNRLFYGDADYILWDDGLKRSTMYKTFCIDVDGINKGEDPFGYGIRADGKIFMGKRATEWLAKSVQSKGDE